MNDIIIYENLSKMYTCMFKYKVKVITNLPMHVKENVLSYINYFTIISMKICYQRNFYIIVSLFNCK